MILLQQLPESVLELVIDSVSFLTDRHTARRTWCSLCRCGSAAIASVAQPWLYRNVRLEYASTSHDCQLFRRTISDSSDLASLVKSISISTALTSRSLHRDRDSQDLALLLRDVLAACRSISAVEYFPDEHARNHESLYLAAWSAGHFSAFTIHLNKFRELALLPAHSLRSLTLQLAPEGDLQWDYDIFLQSWPSRVLAVHELRLVKLQFPAYADQVMLEKLQQLCRAIHPPQKLHIISCCFSMAAITWLLEHWAAPQLRCLNIERCTISCDARSSSSPNKASVDGVVLFNEWLCTSPALRDCHLRTEMVMSPLNLTSGDRHKPRGRSSAQVMHMTTG